MPPERKRSSRKSQTKSVTVGLPLEVIAKRNKRHLDELERSNYAEPSMSVLGVALDDEDGGKTAKGRTRTTISDTRVIDGRKKKSTMNVRTALLYRKNLNTLIEESNIAALPLHAPSYLTAVTPSTLEPARSLCTVCGYWGRYKCLKCSMAYCDSNCGTIHDETRCERRVI